mmetsp:Transcript_30537/g.34965  ORF Transcript_30537/g.34965 Transcript_30537/m.34965 type:complete len:402 (-) Transcript_30537:80-1285(-)
MKNSEKTKSTVKIKNFANPASTLLELLLNQCLINETAGDPCFEFEKYILTLNKVVAETFVTASSGVLNQLSHNFQGNANSDFPRSHDEAKKVFAPIPVRAPDQLQSFLKNRLWMGSNAQVESSVGQNVRYTAERTPLRPNKLYDVIPSEPDVYQDSVKSPLTNKPDEFSFEHGGAVPQTAEQEQSKDSINWRDRADRPKSRKMSKLEPDTNDVKAAPTRKPIRKQTSFAKTEEWSWNGIQDDVHILTNMEPKRADDHPVNAKGVCDEQLSKSLALNSAQEDIEVMSYSSQLTMEHDKKVKVISSPEVVHMIGLLTAEERKVKVQNYLAKKQRRLNNSNIRYECRQNLAHKRFRFQGRFIRFEDLHLYKDNLIVDFNGRRLVKPVFKIQKVARKTQPQAGEH